MTPTAQIDFWYEKMLSDGTKEKGVTVSTQSGWWNAACYIEKHGINPPSPTTILNGKEYVYAINKLPYSEKDIIEYFNNPNSYRDGKYPYDLPIINVHLIFKRRK